MKCPKCNFISFDYNQTCPKCGNDLSQVRELMNLPSYQPQPLSVLSQLSGDGQGPGIDMILEGPGGQEGLESVDTHDLLISLDSLSVEELEAGESEITPQGPREEMEKGPEALNEDLTISLDDLLEEPEPISLDPTPSADAGDAGALPLYDTPLESDIFDLESETLSLDDTVTSKAGVEQKGDAGDRAETSQQGEAGFRETGALGQQMPGMELDYGGEEGAGPDLLELELAVEQVEQGGPDKKTL